MRRKVMRAMLVAMSITVAISSMAGCGKQVNTKGSPVENVSETEVDKLAGKDFKYPMESGVTLKYFTRRAPDGKTSFAETELSKNLEKETGVKIEWIHPAKGNEVQQFNLMVASGDLADIIRYDWISYPGGPEKAIKEEVIIPLNDVLPKYSPNLWNVLQKDPVKQKYLKTDEGNYFEYPVIRAEGQESFSASMGPMLRKDWLNELNLAAPETIDEWDTVLRAFKEKKGASSPITFVGYKGTEKGVPGFGAFSGAYGINLDFYIDNSKVKYGFAEPAYKEFLTLFRKWYKDGLLDKDIATVDDNIVRSKMLTGKAGAALGNFGGTMEKILDSKPEGSFDLVGTRMPVLKKGQKPEFGSGDLGFSDAEAVAISGSCKNVAVAARFLDYTYSEKGALTQYFGVEGITYNLVNGKPVPIDYSKDKNKEKEINDLKYNEGNLPGTRWQNPDTRGKYPQSKDAAAKYADTNYKAHFLPPIYPSTEESEKLATLENEIGTYVKEMYLKFIFGDEPLENFDKYIQQLNKMGMSTVLEIKQKAYDRYMKR